MRKNQSKNKDLCNIEVLTADKVWNKDHKTLRKDLNIFGKVEKSYSAYVSNTNLKGKNNKFVEDFSALNKKTKNEIVNFFNNENRKVVYLIKKPNK